MQKRLQRSLFFNPSHNNLTTAWVPLLFVLVIISNSNVMLKPPAEGSLKKNMDIRDTVTENETLEVGLEWTEIGVGTKKWAILVENVVENS
jgi:hypothetical protein